MGQILFILTAVLCLVAHQQSSPFARPVIIGLVLLTMGIAGFIYTQRRGGDLLKRAGRMLGHNMAAQWQDAMLSSADSIQERFDAIWSHPRRIVEGALLHYVGWLGSAATIWVAYYFLGAHLSFGGAVAIEGVACGIMSVSFLVPAGLGVQEAAYITLGSAFGIAPSISLGLSLLRRGRELVIGIPMLLLWQAMEMRALRHKKAAPHSRKKRPPASPQARRRTDCTTHSFVTPHSQTRPPHDGQARPPCSIRWSLSAPA